MTPVPEAVRATHRSLSSRGARFLEMLERPGFARRALLEGAGLPEWFREKYPMQAWPILVAPPRLHELRDAPVRLARVIKRIPERVFGSDPAAIAEFYGLPSADHVTAILAPPDGRAGLLGRSDFIDTADGLRCLEFNMSSCLGGWQVRYFADEALEQPWMRELREETEEGPLFLTDPLKVLFSHLVDEARAAGLADGGELHLAFLTGEGVGVGSSSAMSRSIDAAYRSFLDETCPGLDGTLRFASYDEVEPLGGTIQIAGRPIQVVVEYHGPVTDPRIFRAFKSGRIHLYNGPVAFLLRDKRNLGLLSEHQDSGRFEPEEREVIRSLVPWTRVTRPGRTVYEGAEVDLRALALGARDRMVLKPGVGLRGESVLMGCAISAERWERGVETAFGSGRWILQERVLSRPYWYPVDDERATPHDLIWGLFAFGERYGGGVLRMMPQDVPGVINNALGAALGLFLESE